MSNPTENGNNRKEEILAKSRQSNKDEGLEYLDLKGKKHGEIVGFHWIGYPLLLFSIVTGQVGAVLALAALTCAFDGGNWFAIYRISKQTRYLAASVIVAIIAVLAIFFFVGYALEWDVIPQWLATLGR